MLHAVPAILAKREIDGPIESRVRKLMHTLQELLTSLATGFSGPSTDAPQSFDAAKTYCALYAGACAYCVWYFNRDNACLELDPAFRRGAWLCTALDALLDVPDAVTMHDDLHRWLERLVTQERAISMVTLPCPFSMVGLAS